MMEKTERKTVEFKKGYKYQLHKTYRDTVPIYPKQDIKTRFITLTTKGELEIRFGYAWDGASGPTYDSLDSIRGSLVHDALYQLMRMGLLDRVEWKLRVDKLFWRILLEDKMWGWRAKWWFRAVAVGAKSSTLAENKKKVFIAPG